MITAIVAVGKNREIGCNGCLIWRIPEDLKRFKALTMGHPVVMGRKTWESLPKALPGRSNIVISRSKDYKADGAIVVHSIEEALRTAEKCEGGDNVFIIGGGEIYRQTFPLLDVIEVTQVNDVLKEADAYFPEILPAEFTLTVEDQNFRDNGDGLKYIYRTYKRIRL